MFFVKNHKQPYIFDPFDYLGEKRRDLLDKSWAGLFRQEILPVLPVDALRKHYHDCQGRLSKELYSMVGLMILQRIFGVRSLKNTQNKIFKDLTPFDAGHIGAEDELNRW